MPIKEVWKSVKIWRYYRHEFGVFLFGAQSISVLCGDSCTCTIHPTVCPTWFAADTVISGGCCVQHVVQNAAEWTTSSVLAVALTTDSAEVSSLTYFTLNTLAASISESVKQRSGVCPSDHQYACPVFSVMLIQLCPDSASVRFRCFLRRSINLLVLQLQQQNMCFVLYICDKYSKGK